MLFLNVKAFAFTDPNHIDELDESDEIVPTSVKFSPDGKTMFHVGVNSTKLRQYSLSTGFDLSTASEETAEIDLSDAQGGPQDIAFNSDGTILFIIGTILMRSAGCVINDFFDRDFDGNVERTKERPIATGEISPNEALLLFFFLVLCSACLLLFMNLLTFLMALLGLGLATFYPISKRFFPIPQVFLGLAFSWGIIMVSSAQLGEINILSLALFLSCFFWIIAYDTAYALCDKKDDLDLGIHSSAITFGKNVTAFFFLLHFVS